LSRCPQAAGQVVKAPPCDAAPRSGTGRPDRRVGGRLISDTSSDFPVAAHGFVRTFLYPCPFYGLQESRTLALKQLALTTGARSFSIKLLRGSSWEWQRSGPLVRPVREEIEILANGTDEQKRNLGFRQRPIELWLTGTWASDVDEDGEMHDGGFELLEHVLLDDRGSWTIVFSDEDFAHLISKPSTRRELLERWHTTAQAEIDAYATSVSQSGQKRVPAASARPRDSCEPRTQVDAPMDERPVISTHDATPRKPFIHCSALHRLSPNGDSIRAPRGENHSLPLIAAGGGPVDLCAPVRCEECIQAERHAEKPEQCKDAFKRRGAPIPQLGNGSRHHDHSHRGRQLSGTGPLH
jgi:hypothetical protein